MGGFVDFAEVKGALLDCLCSRSDHGRTSAAPGGLPAWETAAHGPSSSPELRTRSIAFRRKLEGDQIALLSHVKA